jgi:hypothetical protein
VPRNLQDLYGVKLSAVDGEIGHIEDFYFDDETWVVRYVVAKTGSWLTGKKVLLSPYAFGPLRQDVRPLPVNLTRQQIENCPPVEEHRPISRQYEVKYYHYYGWPTYWEGSWTWGIGRYPVMLPPASPPAGAADRPPNQAESHLRSTRAVDGFPVETYDGPLGHLLGFSVDPQSWVIRDVIVKTGHWRSGKELLISPAQIDDLSYPEGKMFVNLTKEDLEQTANDKVVQAGSGVLDAGDFQPPRPVVGPLDRV